MANTRHAGVAKGDDKHINHSPGNPAPEANMAHDAINIGLNVFKIGIVKYSPEEQDALEWLWGYAFDVLNGSKFALEKETGLPYETIYQIFTGRHAGSLASLLDLINNLKIKVVNTIPLVETETTRKICDVLDYARDWHRMIAISGGTGRGKTYTAKYWARNNNHGRTRYIRCRSNCTRRTLVTQLCQVCGIGVNGKKTSELEDRLYRAFGPRNVIIVDEAGFLLPRNGTRPDAIEFLRDLHDERECAVAMIFTDVYIDELKNGRNADFFEQFIGRIGAGRNVRIPHEIHPSEIAAILKSFVPSPSVDLVKTASEIVSGREGKLRALFEDLTRARDFATQQGRTLAAKDLIIASRMRQSGENW